MQSVPKFGQIEWHNNILFMPKSMLLILNVKLTHVVLYFVSLLIGFVERCTSKLIHIHWTERWGSLWSIHQTYVLHHVWRSNVLYHRYICVLLICFFFFRTWSFFNKFACRLLFSRNLTSRLWFSNLETFSIAWPYIITTLESALKKMAIYSSFLHHVAFGLDIVHMNITMFASLKRILITSKCNKFLATFHKLFRNNLDWINVLIHPFYKSKIIRHFSLVLL